ncbi:MAG: CDP-alcohol phosphatidyltransferase family protein [Actinomycetota bacterium]
MERSASSADDADGEVVLDRVLTIPNLISATRIALIPIFAWAFLTGRDLPAFILLVVIGSSDWVDGYVARKTGQVSKLGKLLDPVADRMAIIVVLIALAFRGVIDAPIAYVLLIRDAIVSIAFPILERKGVPRIPVNWVGKWATALIFAGMGFAAASVLDIAAAGFAAFTSRILLIAGAVLYWWAAALYVKQIRRLLRSGAAR